jgi:uncharacterized protein (DUF433 family)
MSATKPRGLGAPLYPVSEAARYTHTKPQTLRRWVEGHRIDGTWYPPFLEVPDDKPYDQTALSFETLIEAALISVWRSRGIPLQRIRRARTLATEEYGSHPFARKKIYVSGLDLFAEADEETADARGRMFTTLTRGGQRALGPAIEQYLEHIDWRSGNGEAYQWRPPEGGDVVRLNPEIEFGLPNVRRVRTEILLQRWLAPEPIEVIAEDFDLELREVEMALRYEWALNQAA